METEGLLITNNTVERVVVDGYESIKTLVGGWIDAVRTSDGEMVGYVHDEGLITGLPMNPIATAMFGTIIAGPCVLLHATNAQGETDGADYSLTESDLRRVAWLAGAYRMWIDAHLARAEFV